MGEMIAVLKVLTITYLFAKVERHRQRRAAFFSELERESEGDARAMAMEGTSDPARLAVNMMAHDTHRLQAILDGVEAIAIAGGVRVRSTHNTRLSCCACFG